MKIEDLKKQGLEEHDLEYRGQCHDCSTPVSVLISVIESGAITIGGGAIYKVKKGFVGDGIFFKCDECFKIDKTLRNYQDCEVYSRVVGYLRPVGQWNKGKVAEWNARKEFINTKGR
jgi:hypothetical protein